MNKRRIFLHSLNRFCMAGAFIAVMLFAACDDDEIMEGRPNWDTICFNPVQQTDGWNDLSQTRSAGDGPSADSASVVKLDYETPDGEPLYLHTHVSNGIDCERMTEEMQEEMARAVEAARLAGTEEPENSPATRGVKVDGTNFHSTFGMFAVSYEGAFDASKNFDLMNNLKVEQGKSWATGVKWPTTGRVRFYAYAPHSTAIGNTNFTITAKKETNRQGPVLTLSQKATIRPTDSQDVVYAYSDVPARNNGQPVSLTFKHILAAIRIKTHGTNFFEGTLKSLKILNAYMEADYNPQSATSNNILARRNKGTITLYQNATGKTITANTDLIDGGYFFMIPQNVNKDGDQIRLEIVFRPKNQTQDRTFTLDLTSPTTAGWFQNNTYTYTISNSESVPTPEWDYTFEVDNTGGIYNLDFNLSTQDIGVRCYSNPRGKPNEKTAVDWNYEYSTDDGKTWLDPTIAGSSNILNTFGLTKVIPAGNDGTKGKITASAKYVVERQWYNIEDETLKNRPWIGSENHPYNLATLGGREAESTANCYIVNGPGWYMFPIKFGNSFKNGSLNTRSYIPQQTHASIRNPLRDATDSPVKQALIHNNSAALRDVELFWQDAPNLVTNVQYHQGTYIKFYVNPNNIKQGNAVISALSYNGEILWSWHIWVTPYGLEDKHNDYGNSLSDITIYDNSNNSYRMMGMPLGHCTGDSRIYSRRTIKLRFTSRIGTEKIITLQRQEFRERKPGNTLIYQWGRPTPIPGGTYVDSSNYLTPVPQKTVYWGNRFSSKFFKVLLKYVNTWEVLQYPEEIYAPSGTNGQGQWPWYWESDKYRNRWNNNPLLNDDPSAGRVVKTIYDPSPRGYAVPPGRAFEQFLTSGMSNMLYSDLSYWNAQIRSQAEYIKEYGARFRVRRGAQDWETIFLPSTGFSNVHRWEDQQAPKIYDTALRGVYWMADLHWTTGKASALHFGFGENAQPHICVRYYDGTSDCNAILPVRE